MKDYAKVCLGVSENIYTRSWIKFRCLDLLKTHQQEKIPANHNM